MRRHEAEHASPAAATRSVTAKNVGRAEVIRRSGPWRGLEPVGWVDWFDHRRLLEQL